MLKIALDDYVDFELEHCGRDLRPMVPLGDHAYEIAQLIRSPGIELVDVATWLEIAAGLVKVDVDFSSYDDSLMYCRLGWAHISTSSEIATAMLYEISRFQFVWNSVEAFIGENHRRSKVRVVASLLDKRDTNLDPLAHYDCVVSALRHFVTRSDSFAYLSTEFPGGGRSSAAVFRGLSRLRNSLAHGVFALPAPSSRGGRILIELSLVRCATRLVLFTLQKLLLITAPVRMVIEQKSGYDGDYIDRSVGSILADAHLTNEWFDPVPEIQKASELDDPKVQNASEAGGRCSEVD